MMRCIACLSLLTVCAVAAASPTDKPGSASLPPLQRLQIYPERVVLIGPRAAQQVVVNGHFLDGAMRDLTSQAQYRLEGPAVARCQPTGYVTAAQDGTATLVVEVAGQSARVPVEVRAAMRPQPISFRREIMAVLNVAGCNQGACHGSPSGKNGFRLSLRGYDPAADHEQLTRDVLGRRTSALSPENSLIVQKALGRVPHEGGQRFAPGSHLQHLLTSWIQEGMHDDPESPLPVTLQAYPTAQVQVHPAWGQQLAVQARFADGSVADVTRLCNYASSDPALADVDATGWVRFQQPGEATILIRYLEAMTTVRLVYLKPDPQFRWPEPPEHNYIDRLVFAKLKKLGLAPSELCTDEEYLRRVYLDLCGILPSVEETRQFVTDKRPDKRTRIVERLVQRPEFADFWALKWADILRSSRKSVKLAGVFKFREWLRFQIASNRPLDELVYDLLTAQGSSFANPAANYYRVARDPQSLAETTAQLFLGVRMQCAKCHNHPFERWTQDDYYGLAAVFARVKVSLSPEGPGAAEDEYVVLDRAGEVTQPRTQKTMMPTVLGTSLATDAADRRQALARWLVSKDNPFFARSLANRIWYHLLGRGIVEPVDDFRDSNPPSHEELLDALARDLVEHRYDLRYLVKTITASRVYQLSAQPNATNKDDQKYFSRAITKMLTAEQLLDALCQATEVPEKYPGLPLGTRATQLPDGEFQHVFLKTFGQPARELPCECERESDTSLAQALQLINGQTVHGKLRQPHNRIGRLLAAKATPEAIVEELYLATLSRYPEATEKQVVLDYVRRHKDARRAWEDVQWALINCKEFLFRH